MPSARCWTDPTRWTPFRSRSRSPEEVPWESCPEGADWLANELRLSKGGFMHFWRSYLDPIWNHYIRGPVRSWSASGRYRESELWEAVKGYLDLLDASQSSKPDT